MIGHLNVSSAVQRKLPNSCLSPSICPLCHRNGEGPCISSSSVRTHHNVGRSYFLSLIFLGCLVLTFKEISSNF